MVADYNRIFTKTFTSLSNGSHTVDVKDDKGYTKSQSVTVGQPSAVTLSLTKTDLTCAGNDGKITATFGGGISPYQIRVDGVAFATATSPKTFSGLSAGSHTVDLKDLNSCPK